MAELPWMEWAKGELGTKEVPGRGSNARIIEYRKLAGIALDGDDSDVPWCKIFVNAAFRQANLPIEANAMALSITKDPNFVELDGPSPGCVVVYWRGNPHSGTGHIGFYVGENAQGTRILTLGGNEGDMVKQAWFPKNSRAFGLVGYYWPESVDDPTDGKLVVDDDGEPVGSAE